MLFSSTLAHGTYLLKKTVLTPLSADFIMSVIPKSVSIDNFFPLSYDLFLFFHLPGNFLSDVGYCEFYIVEYIFYCIPIRKYWTLFRHAVKLLRISLILLRFAFTFFFFLIRAGSDQC